MRSEHRHVSSTPKFVIEKAAASSMEFYKAGGPQVCKAVFGRREHVLLNFRVAEDV